MKSEHFASKPRQFLLKFVIISVFAIYFLKLFQMQILQTDIFNEKASGNSIKSIEASSSRGVFYDRNLLLWVDNIPSYTVRIIPEDFEKKNCALVESILNFEKGHIEKFLLANKAYPKHTPLKLKRAVDFRTIGWIDENSERLPGIDYVIDIQRGYPSTVRGTHFLGYSREVSGDMLKKDDFYQPGDFIGFTGLEKNYEEDLRGTKGFNYIVVNNKGKFQNKLEDGNRDVPPEKGRDLVLSVDKRLQTIAEKALAGRSGAIVAIEPSTGEILCMASAPDYDLAKFSDVLSKEFMAQLTNDPLRPQFNRATQAAFSPGSTFKLFCAAVALDMGVISANDYLYCNGGYTYGNRTFKCHGGVHGGIAVVRAIEQSCNAYFYQLIFKIGLDNLSRYAEKFGLGRKTGIDMVEEVSGLIPNIKYYEKIHGENWPRGMVVSLGIGQGEISITPMQLAHMTALIANNGQSYVPHLVKGYLEEGKKFIPYEFKKEDLGMKKEAFETVKQGMYLVVNGNGTATNIKMADIVIAGKTGTVQNPHGLDHSVFIGFAPFDDPKIAVAVIIENVGFGSSYAAPISKIIIESYLKKGGAADTAIVVKPITVQGGFFAD